MITSRFNFLFPIERPINYLGFTPGLLTLFLLLIVFPSFLWGQDPGQVLSQDDLEIRYTKYGKGKKLLVFVHGWSCDQGYWKDQIDFFQKDYRVVTIDLGGHGKSGTERTNWTISSFGDDVVAVVKALRHKEIYLVGHSMGGMVVLDAASKLKARKMKVFPVDVISSKWWPISAEVFQDFSKPFKKDFKKQVQAWVSGFFAESSDATLIKWIVTDMSQAPAEIALAALQDLWTRDYDETVARLHERQIPMILINKDRSKEEDKTLLKSMGFDMEVIPDVGHFIMMEKPATFNRKLKELIQHP